MNIIYLCLCHSCHSVAMAFLGKFTYKYMYISDKSVPSHAFAFDGGGCAVDSHCSYTFIRSVDTTMNHYKLSTIKRKK